MTADGQTVVGELEELKDRVSGLEADLLRVRDGEAAMRAILDAAPVRYSDDLLGSRYEHKLSYTQALRDPARGGASAKLGRRASTTEPVSSG